MMTILLELLAHLDWFERVDEFAKMLRGVRSWRFSVPRSGGWSGHRIEQMLRRYGIEIWGRNFNRSHLFFRVKLQQANWAEYLLWRNGIPVHSRPFNPQNRLYGSKHAPPPKPPQEPGVLSL
jgi:hypothetical protein